MQLNVLRAAHFQILYNLMRSAYKDGTQYVRLPLERERVSKEDIVESGNILHKISHVKFNFSPYWANAALQVHELSH